MEKPWLRAYPEGTPAEVDADAYPSLVAILEESCRRFADRPAFHNLGTTLTYSDLDRLSTQFAGYLASLGLAHGDRVAIMMPNLLQYPVALFGILRAGLTVVNTNPLYTARELRHQLVDSGARCIVVLENFAHVVAAVRAETKLEHIITTAVGDLVPFPKRAAVNFVVRHVKKMVPAYAIPDALDMRSALTIGAASDARPVAVGAQDIAFLQYTGGTTGIAKGAMLTHRNMVANLAQVAAFWKGLIEPGREIMITPLPLYHVFCLTCNCLVFMHHGGLNVLITNPRDIAGVGERAAQVAIHVHHRREHALQRVAQSPGFRAARFLAPEARRRPAAWRCTRALRRGWRATTNRWLAEGYGLTESSPVVTCNPYDDATDRHRRRAAALHRNQHSRRRRTELPAGETGELCVRGPQVMRGYWNRPDETGEGHDPRWLAAHRRHRNRWTQPGSCASSTARRT